MKYIIKVADKNETGVAFDTVTNFVEELLTMVKDAVEAGGSIFVVEVDTDAGEFSLVRTEDADMEAKDEDEMEIGSER